MKNSLKIPSIVLDAIGELMTTNGGESNYTVIKFTEFVTNYRSPDFKRWFSNFDNIFHKLRKSKEDPNWNALIILQVSILLFTLNLGRKEGVILKEWFSPAIMKYVSIIFWLPSKIIKQFRLLSGLVSTYRYQRRQFKNVIKFIGKPRKKEPRPLESRFPRVRALEVENRDGLKFYSAHIDREYDTYQYYLEHGTNDSTIMNAVSSLVYLDQSYLNSQVLRYLRYQLKFYGYLSKFDKPYYDCMKLADDIMNESPEKAFIWNMKGLALKSLGEYDDAYSCFNNAINGDDTFTQSFLNKGLMIIENNDHYRMEDLESAKGYFEKLLSTPSRNSSNQLTSAASIWNNIGICNFSLGKYKEAFKCFQKSTDLNSKFIIASHNRDITLYKLG
jgi:tetratricopeptide (TPR) repeat protein